MKIAYVYDAVYPWEKGGAQKRVWEIARRLTEDHDVHLYGMRYWDGPSVIEKEGVTLHGVCDPQDLYVEGRRSISQALYFSAHLVPSLLGEDFDVIDCQEFPYFPVFVSKAHEQFRGSTLVVTWYEHWGDYWCEYLGSKGVFGKQVERLALRVPTHVIPISDAIKADVERFGRDHDVTVVPNGVDYDGIQAVPGADADWDVIYVGRLSEHKNVDVLLEAVEIAADEFDVTCGIIGDGPERESLVDCAVELGVDDRVEFLGFVEEDDDVIGYLKVSDVFVLPSTREGFPNTILEANACGVPAVVIDHEENGGTAVVEDGKTGYITELDPEVIADRIVDVCTDDSHKQDLREHAEAFGRNHDWDVIVSEMEQTYLSSVMKT